MADLDVVGDESDCDVEHPRRLSSDSSPTACRIVSSEYFSSRWGIVNDHKQELRIFASSVLETLLSMQTVTYQVR